MREPRYSAAPYPMRRDDAWMVYEDRTGRVVTVRLRKPQAYTLAHLLNVADLDVPLKDYSEETR